MAHYLLQHYHRATSPAPLPNNKSDCAPHTYDCAPHTYDCAPPPNHFPDNGRQVKNYEGFSDPAFIICFALSCVMGLVLNFSIVMCTHCNSALTTTIIGVLKNLFITYLGYPPHSILRGSTIARF